MTADWLDLPRELIELAVAVGLPVVVYGAVPLLDWIRRGRAGEWDDLRDDELDR